MSPGVSGGGVILEWVEVFFRQGVPMSYHLQTPEPPIPSEVPPATPQPETPIEPPEPDLPAIGDPPTGPDETPRSLARSLM